MHRVVDSLFDQVKSVHSIDNPSPMFKNPLKGDSTQAPIPEYGDCAVFITVDHENFSKIQCRAQCREIFLSEYHFF